jgi:hypothetical protein
MRVIKNGSEFAHLLLCECLSSMEIFSRICRRKRPGEDPFPHDNPMLPPLTKPVGFISILRICGYFLVNPGGELFFCYGKVVMRLEVHPALSVGAKKTCQPQRRICRYRALSRYDFPYAPLRHPDRLGKSVLGNAHGPQEVLVQYFARVHRGHVSFHAASPLMVINYFNFIGITAIPSEANSPLVIDPDRPLTRPVAT